MSQIKEEQLQFDAPPEQDIEYNAPQQSKKEVSKDQFNNLEPSEKRLRILYAIKTGNLDINIFPSYHHKLLKSFANMIEPSVIDGRLIVKSDTSNPNPKIESENKRLKPKVESFIINGLSGDLMDAQNNKMWTDLANSIFLELEPKLHDDHPSRKLEALDKSGELDDIINAHMSKLNLDIFGIPSWFKGALKAVSLQRRQEAKQEKMGIIKENDLILESVRYKLKSILYKKN